MAGQRRERKVVTVVFCDLVGFTSQAESLDPEDVEALLGPYHERVRSELERHGGTVEKFIGDAVMALFGAPTAHEDDPERAVRAALAIRDFAVEEGLELRIGITTGEALVRLDASPEAGEGMASGDVVNTAARLQSAAPVNGVLVDETTHRATRQAIDYSDAEPVEAKGKAEPIAVWEAVAAHSRFGVDIEHEARSTLVGRERELAAVQDAFDRARHQRAPQLLTVVGVPGIGKSRLVWELSRIVDEDEELITWRQGRCLAYGDGITLWALSEIVKAQAGIAEQDTPAEVAEKIHRVAAGAVPESDAHWVESHLLALTGLAEEAELGGDRRNEAFSAWRRFLEGLAERRPLVLVFEDLHWADESLLDFVDELVDWVTDVPLLVVATARPELLERRPGWAGGKLNATTLALAPLTNEETARLLGDALGRPMLAADQQMALLERAGGNPLYAEQFAELYRERGSADDLPLPETLQGIIAARLDGLGAEEKGLLLDAAVVGRVFWTGSLDRDERSAATVLHSLERKGFVRRQRRSSVEGQSEIAFAHALVRDVAYGQIPRAERAAKHARVAEWIESLGRPEDHAEMRAYHWLSALELTRASGGDGADLVDRARLSLRDAGERAFSLNSFYAAERYYADALALWPAGDDAGRVELLFRNANALYLAGDDGQREALALARDAALALDAIDYAAQAEALLAHVAWHRGETDLVVLHLDRATSLVGGVPSAAKARVLTLAGRIRVVSGDPDGGRPLAEEALGMAEELGLDELRAHALATVGTAKSQFGDPEGLADQERALDLALAIDSPIAATIVNNIAVALDGQLGQLVRVADLHEESGRLGERYGDQAMLRFNRGNRVWVYYVLGRWDDALVLADEFVTECEAGSPHVLEAHVREVRANMRLGRGDIEGGLDDSGRALALARQVGDMDLLGAALSVRGAMCAVLDRWPEAHEIASELVTLAPEMPRGIAAFGLLAPYADRLHELGAIHTMLEGWTPDVWTDQIRYALEGDLIAAADLLAALPSVTLESRMRMAAGERLLAERRLAEGTQQLLASLAFHRSVGATYWIRRAEDLLAGAQRDSA
jgi:class 3 adenylate cyclase/tetratricopeptide (TPR) repeat protein